VCAPWRPAACAVQGHKSQYFEKFQNRYKQQPSDVKVERRTQRKCFEAEGVKGEAEQSVSRDRRIFAKQPPTMRADKPLPQKWVPPPTSPPPMSLQPPTRRSSPDEVPDYMYGAAPMQSGAVASGLTPAQIHAACHGAAAGAASQAISALMQLPRPTPY
jgi:hypothetical protein